MVSYLPWEGNVAELVEYLYDNWYGVPITAVIILVLLWRILSVIAF